MAIQRSREPSLSRAWTLVYAKGYPQSAIKLLNHISILPFPKNPDPGIKTRIIFSVNRFLGGPE